LKDLLEERIMVEEIGEKGIEKKNQEARCKIQKE
jgi:hypothetical protein